MNTYEELFALPMEERQARVNSMSHAEQVGYVEYLISLWQLEEGGIW